MTYADMLLLVGLLYLATEAGVWLTGKLWDMLI